MSRKKRRLPLPGEKPIFIFQPVKKNRTHPFFDTRTGFSARLWRLLPLVIPLTLILIGWQVWRITRIPVTLVINGHPTELQTHRRNIEGILRTAGIDGEGAYFIDPPPDTLLQKNMVITVAHQQPVILHAEGQTIIAPATQNIPRAIAESQGIFPGVFDAVRVNRAVRPAPRAILNDPALAAIPALPREVEVIRARQITVAETAPGATIPTHVSFQSTALTIGQALAEAGYTIYGGDQISPSPGSLLPTEPTTITLRRGVPLIVHADGQIISPRTQQASVLDLITELGLALNDDDYLIPSAETAISEGLSIRLVRVHEEILTEAIPIPYETLTIPDPLMGLDQQREVSAGEDGITERQISVRYEDGQEVSRIITGQWTTKKPQARVLAYGTKIIIRPLETPTGTLYYWRKLRMLATSYSPLTAGSKQPGDPFFGLSGTGDPMQRGIVATDPRVVPLYTRLYVPDYGPAQALDIGGAIKGMRIDLGYDDDNLSWWNNWVDVYLLIPVPPTDRIVWILPDQEVED